MAAGRGGDADRRGGVPLVLAAAVRVHVGVARARPPSPWRRPSRAARARRRARRRGTRRARAAACATRGGGSGPSAGGASAGGGVAVEQRLALARAARPRDAVGVAVARRARRARPSRCGRLRRTRACRRAGRRSTPVRASRRTGIVLRLLGEDRVVGPVLAQERRGSGRWPGGRRRPPVPPSARSRSEELAGAARGVGGERVIVHVIAGFSETRSRSWLRGPAQHARVDRLHEHQVDVGAAADELVGVAVEQQQDRRARRGGRPTPRGGGRSRRRRRPCCRSAGRARRGRGRPRRTCRARPGRGSPRRPAGPGRRTRPRTWSRTHLRVGGHEDRRAHRGQTSSSPVGSPRSTWPTSWSAAKS